MSNVHVITHPGAAQADPDAQEGRQHQQLSPPAGRTLHADGLRGHARDMPLQEAQIQTPLETMTAKVIDGKKLVLVSIPRAATGFSDGMLNVVPGARIGHIGLYRDPTTLQPVEYYFKMPSEMAERDVIVVDPMLATGNSAAAAVERIKKLRPRSISSSACWLRRRAWPRCKRPTPTYPSSPLPSTANSMTMATYRSAWAMRAIASLAPSKTTPPAWRPPWIFARSLQCTLIAFPRRVARQVAPRFWCWRSACRPPPKARHNALSTCASGDTAALTDADIQTSRQVWHAPGSLPDKPMPVFQGVDMLNLFIVVESGSQHVTVLDGDRFEPLHRFALHRALQGAPVQPRRTLCGTSVVRGLGHPLDLWNLQAVAEVRAGPGQPQPGHIRQWQIPGRGQPATAQAGAARRRAKPAQGASGP